MHLHLPRLRVRTLMIAVAVFALALGSIPYAVRFWFRGLSAEYTERAANHARLEEACIQAAVKIHAQSKKHRKYDFPFDKVANRTADHYERLARLNERRAEYEAALVEKYLRAARYPWRPVEPDPRVPKLEPQRGGYPYWLLIKPK
jgi:hypothetical protein